MNKQDLDFPQENPLNPIKRESEILGMKIILSELITAARRVGATSITVEALQKRLEELI